MVWAQRSPQPPDRGEVVGRGVETRGAQAGVGDDDDAPTGFGGAQAVVDQRESLELRVQTAESLVGVAAGWRAAPLTALTL